MKSVDRSSTFCRPPSKCTIGKEDATSIIATMKTCDFEVQEEKVEVR